MVFVNERVVPEVPYSAIYVYIHIRICIYTDTHTHIYITLSLLLSSCVLVLVVALLRFWVGLYGLGCFRAVTGVRFGFSL